MKKLYLKRGKEESLLRFHPWVFSGAIQQADEDLEDGDLVRVLTNHGDFIAVGHFQKGSIATPEYPKITSVFSFSRHLTIASAPIIRLPPSNLF